MNFYLQFEDILRELNIYCDRDFNKKYIKFGINNMLPVIEDLYNIIHQHQKSISEKFDFRKYIGVDFGDSYCSNNIISKYTCMLPQSTLLLGTIPEAEEEEEDGEVLERSYSFNNYEYTENEMDEIIRNMQRFINEFFSYKDVLTTGITEILPFFSESEGRCYDPKLYDKLHIITTIEKEENIADKPFGIYASFPWLYDARTTDYIELCLKYPTEFNFLAHTIQNLIKNVDNNESNTNTQIANDITDALINIRINYEKKQAELKTKGIRTIIGLAMTFLPIINNFKVINPEVFSGLCGGYSLFEASSLFDEYTKIKNTCRENPFWLIWKWQKKIK